MERVPQASNLVSNALYLVLLQEQTGIAVEKIRLLIRQVFPDSCRLPRKHQKADVLVFHSLDPLPFNYIALFRSNCQIKGFMSKPCLPTTIETVYDCLDRLRTYILPVRKTAIAMTCKMLLEKIGGKRLSKHPVVAAMTGNGMIPDVRGHVYRSIQVFVAIGPEKLEFERLTHGIIIPEFSHSSHG
jgi:hypothetical protein